MSHSDRLPELHPTIYDMSLHFDRQSHRLRLAVFFGKLRAIPMIGSSFVAQTTTSRRVRALLPLDRADLVQSVYRLMRDTVGLFFKPTDDGTPRNTERAFKSTQATPFLIRSKNLFPSFSRISRSLRMFATLAATRTAQVFLLAIWRDSILYQRRIATMTARHRCRIHGVNPFSSVEYEQYTTPFDLRPLPGSALRSRAVVLRPASGR